MTVLFDHRNPFLLAHGGLQIQIEQTYAALREIGVAVDYLRWWDEKQCGDIIHYFGRPSMAYLSAAQAKGLKVIMAELLTGLGSRPAWVVRAEAITLKLAQRWLPPIVTYPFAWQAFRQADACIALTSWEGHLMELVHGTPHERIHVIPNGVEQEFLKAEPAPRGRWLVCTATITERKRPLELAEAAVQAQTPIRIIGKPYSAADPYGRRFLDFATRHPQWIAYEGAISDRLELARIYRQARGFVLLSTKESLSLSALEAAACECPLLLSDLPWARTVFRDNAAYCPISSSVTRTAEVLRKFYQAAPNLETPPKPLAWSEVAQQLKSLYESL
jgi:glycosyltransferase involved in cell wall biosynthesis